jgi:hypothetical protein
MDSKHMMLQTSHQACLLDYFHSASTQGSVQQDTKLPSTPGIYNAYPDYRKKLNYVSTIGPKSRSLCTRRNLLIDQTTHD